MSPIIRPSTADDIAAITAIYADNVIHGTGTFELDPPDIEEMTSRRDDVLSKGLPYLVAEHDGAVVGYAYANWFRPRPAYRFCVEDSVYLSPDARGLGVGTALLTELISGCIAAGMTQMIALIGDSDNAGSVGLHRKLGFSDVGVMVATGRKFDRWLDVVIMQRTLGEGDGTAPVSAEALQG